jgi:DNA-binding beta-propeller fold protein YncE
VAWNEWTYGPGCPDGWSHHGVAVLPDGTVVAYHPGVRRLLFFDGAGALLREVDCDALEAHDIEVAAGGETLWIADCGHKLCRDGGDRFVVEPALDDAVGQVLLVDLEGRTLRTIGPIGTGRFLPTGVAVDGERLWIADGYGSNLVHLLDAQGSVLLTLDGFDCPHGIAVDRRRDTPTLVIAERGARRLCVHALDGTFLRHVGAGDVLMPCAVATSGDLLLVADLVGRVAVFDLDDRLVGYIGADREATKRPGWPNAVPIEGLFNSPHGIAVDAADGRAVVTEWLLGGRWVTFDVDVSRATTARRSPSGGR